MKMFSKNVVSLFLAFAAFMCCSVPAFASQEIADGTYTVNVYLWHSVDDKESMAADALEEIAYIVAENGTYTMYIRTGEMTMMFITASLQELYISDSNGNYTDAVVEATDSSGNPTGFYFVLPHTEEYVDVKVNPHIAMMGNRAIGARIKVDYSTLTKTYDYVSPAQETTTPETTTTETTTVQPTTTAVTTTETTTVVTTTETTTEEITTEPLTEPVTQPDTIEYEAETTADKNKSAAPEGWIIAIIVLVILAAVAGVVILIIKKRA